MGILERLDERLERIEAQLEALSGRPEPAPVTSDAARWLDPKGAADYVGMSHQSLALWRSKGTGPAFSKVGGSIRYSTADLDDWLSENRRRA